MGSSVGMMGSDGKRRHIALLWGKEIAGALERIMTSIKSCKTLKHGCGSGGTNPGAFCGVAIMSYATELCESIHL